MLHNTFRAEMNIEFSRKPLIIGHQNKGMHEYQMKKKYGMTKILSSCHWHIES